MQEIITEVWWKLNSLNLFSFAGNAALYNVAFTMSVELVPEKYVVPVGILLGIPYSMGVIVAGLLPLLGVTQWRHLHLYFGVPILASVLLVYFLPESPRWQVIWVVVVLFSLGGSFEFDFA